VSALVANPTPAPYPLEPARAAEDDDLILAIRREDPAAAERLYNRYAAGLTLQLCRKTGSMAVAEYVFEILVEATRQVRLGAVRDVNGMNAFILRRAGEIISRCGADAVAGRSASKLNLRNRHTVVSRVFTRLSSQEQEILLRCYVLNQADDQIARSMAVPDSFVNGVRTRVRIAIQNVSESRSAQPDLTV
jgi:hypothetical protein